MSRVLGVDLGERRIGLALSDPSGVLASPLDTLERSGERADDHHAIVTAATEVGATRIVIGLPRSLSGQVGPAARSVLEEVAAITEVARAAGIEVDTYDERFSTMIAQRNLRAATPRRSKRQRAQRERIDASAAAVILQSWIDAADLRHLVTDSDSGSEDDPRDEPWPPPAGEGASADESFKQDFWAGSLSGAGQASPHPIAGRG